MRHIKKISVQRAQILELDPTQLPVFIVWVISIIGFVKQYG